MVLLNGDCLDKLKELEADSVDSIVTDPPYGLAFMGKKWDYDVPSQAIWEECMRVLKPGGHLLSFAGSRTYHRMAVRIEDAGFEIRDQIMWIYGSGFPKSHNIGKAVDKIGGSSIGWFGEWLKEWREENNIAQSQVAKLFPSKTGGLTGCVSNWELGKNIPTLEEYNKIVEEFDLPFKSLEELEREVIGKKNSACFGKEERHTIGSSTSVEVEITKGNSDWEGWGTALKPAHEPIVMARKPFKGNVANNVLEWGTGGINVDGCRIGMSDDDIETNTKKASKENNGVNFDVAESKSKGTATLPNTQGRFPANIIFDEEAGKILDEQSGMSKSKRINCIGGFGVSDTIGANKKEGGSKIKSIRGHNDEGGASRFFYCPKSSKKDRNEGLDHIQPQQIKGRDEGQDKTSIAYKARPTERQNVHPTVKPTDLMAYLIRLITPKGGLVLDPFMGSGSTGKAAVREGMNFIGIEREDEYMEIAKSRIDYELKKNKHTEFFDI